MKRYLGIYVLLFCLFLTACGGPTSSSVTASTPTAPSTTDAPSVTPTASGDPTVLHVTRTDPSATNNIGPLDKTITDSATVQDLFSMAKKSPAYPTGTSISESCLNDLGVIYHLDFLQGTTEVQRMNLDPGNCKVLYLSQTDLRQASDTFLNRLKEALQVTSLTSN